MAFGLNNNVQGSGVTTLKADVVTPGGTLEFNDLGEIYYIDPNGTQFLLGWNQEKLNINFNGVVKYENSKFTLEQGATLELNDQNVNPISGAPTDMLEVIVNGVPRQIPLI